MKAYPDSNEPIAKCFETMPGTLLLVVFMYYLILFSKQSNGETLSIPLFTDWEAETRGNTPKVPQLVSGSAGI